MIRITTKVHSPLLLVTHPNRELLGDKLAGVNNLSSSLTVPIVPIPIHTGCVPIPHPVPTFLIPIPMVWCEMPFTQCTNHEHIFKRQRRLAFFS